MFAIYFQLQNQTYLNSLIFYFKLVRRSSRIIAAQSANQNAVKENKKASTSSLPISNTATTNTISNETTISIQSISSSYNSNSSSSSSSSSSSLSSSSSSSSTKVNKKLKLKKKSTTTDEDTVTQNQNNEAKLTKMDQDMGEQQSLHQHHHIHQSDGCNIYTECRHCNLLSNQSKNSYYSSKNASFLNNLNNHSQANINNNSNQSTNNPNLASLKKASLKLNLFIEQTMFMDSFMKLYKDIGSYLSYYTYIFELKFEKNI
jgi:hypothetical protein